jgi:hypothetical protein
MGLDGLEGSCWDDMADGVVGIALPGEGMVSYLVWRLFVRENTSSAEYISCCSSCAGGNLFIYFLSLSEFVGRWPEGER